jgi:hypothetical protein
VDRPVVPVARRASGQHNGLPEESVQAARGPTEAFGRDSAVIEGFGVTRRTGPRLTCLAAVFLAGAAAAAGPTADARPSSHVVFVADGAGDYRDCSDTLRRTARADGLPLEVLTFVWSHGRGRMMADQTDTVHCCRRGHELAGHIRRRLADDPDCRISVVGHCAGSLVALTAARHSPPDSLHAVLLMAPSVSADYDVRPALRAARRGLHVFCSHRDVPALVLAVRLVGTCDDPFATRAAGRFGFRLPSSDPMATRLTQYCWRPEYRQLGHDGGHYGAYAPDYLRQVVFPILLAGWSM